MAYAIDITVVLGSSMTGLSLQGSLYDMAGEAVGEAVTAGFVEHGGGFYAWHYDAMPDGFRGAARFAEQSAPTVVLSAVALGPADVERVDVAVSSRAVPADVPTAEAIDAALSESHGEGAWSATADLTAIEADLAAIREKTDLIGSSAVEFAGQVASDGTLELTAGDDYLVAAGTDLRWSVENWAGPSLSGATVELALIPKADYDEADLTAELEVVASCSLDGTTALFVGELTAAQTAALATSPPGEFYNYVYQVRLTTAAAAGSVHVAPGEP